MKKSYHKFFLIFSVLIVIAGLYSYFSNSLISSAAEPSTLTSSLSKNNSSSSNNKIALDIAFIGTLDSLKMIQIDTTLFTSKAFKLLDDNTVQLKAGVSGRANPFSPINNQIIMNNAPVVSQVTTNNPLEIKNKTAVLSGAVKDTNKVTTAYFKYGLTNTLGQKTQPATVSLIGSFISNIINLKSDTTYFYKACAQINSSAFCGDTISFTTTKS